MTKPAADQAFEGLLEFLRDERGFDFTGYKRSTLGRRVRKRMSEVGIEEFEAYRNHLETHPAEFTALFNTILINVTSFFRDPEAWDTLVKEHLPGLIARRRPGDPLRVWSAGCASGQETYTLAMVLAEALGVERFRDEVKIYATDVDDEALAQARAATYRADDLESVPEELRAKYFEPSGSRFAFRGDLRRLVIFGRHDLVRDAPISHLDLLVSRNTLMYFNADTQARIVGRMHFALNDGGILFLGQAEMLRSQGGLFVPLDLKARLFGRTPRANLRERLMMIGPPARPDRSEKLARGVRLRDAALDAQTAAQIVVDLGGNVVLVNAAARVLFDLAAGDEGRVLQDLTVSYRPVELRSHIEQVRAEQRPVWLRGVEFPAPDGDVRHFDVHVTPLFGEARALLGISVAFVDVTQSHRLNSDLQEAHQELETAFEELQSANEELETTNEELQSTIEELETTNEELQSTNEELETMNEELQSTNEELETLNDEMHRRTLELNHVNASMTSILASLRTGVVVLDRGQDIRVWNRKAEDLWGLRADEVSGHAFQNLDIGLPVERLKAAVRACIGGESEYEEVLLDAVNRRGRSIRCRVAVTPFVGVDQEIRGAVLVMEEWRDGGAPPRGDAATAAPA
ncbi:CheR family methyltransferase [Longimicrobium sp.]|uniref:CheR family methyltransferase n=1 Tax=Longimicrobium sp. TaxID=2029185 RepID=UPI002D099499|nr:CheR family methyltransferase [Longimicrobium sp.]HSU14814.1 CheR family methyltransferase [Longimicrobium sp.]